MASPHSSSTTQALNTTNPANAIDSLQLRSALGRYATGVTVITTLDSHGQAQGLTVNSFSALSLDPALVVWSLRLESKLLEVFDQSQLYTVNVLSDQQQAVSQAFASSKGLKFAAATHQITEQGQVLIEGAITQFECQALSYQTAGDHRLYIAKVLKVTEMPGMPLVFYKGQYTQLNPS
jgi:flavin reductase (DIM6/NTAB) family NADH-FMN oxidoreductase RutF